MKYLPSVVFLVVATVYAIQGVVLFTNGDPAAMASIAFSLAASAYAMALLAYLRTSR